MRRVVVTGMSGLCALGSDWPAIEAALRAGRNAVRSMPAWDAYKDLNTRLAAPIAPCRTARPSTSKSTMFLRSWPPARKPAQTSGRQAKVRASRSWYS